MISDRVPVVDVDSHVSEPPDLWTSRLPSRFGELTPRVEYSDELGEDVWVIGGAPATQAWFNSMAGFDRWWPEHPRVQSEVDPAAYDPKARSERLDEYGIRMQVLYPNLLGFNIDRFLAPRDPTFSLACVQAYNDFLVDFGEQAPGRFVPIMALPFWDLEQTLVEVQRSAAAGHKGILFANRPEIIGCPPLTDRAWDPLWSLAQESGLSINFHIGFAGFNQALEAGPDDEPAPMLSTGVFDMSRAEFAKLSALAFMSNGNAIAEVVMSGLCHRFPELTWVSVESGFGYVPYLLEALDWQWLNAGAAKENPDRLMPSEYFRRQMYGTFWFEKLGLERLVDLYPDNMMFETDFPHPTSLSPGPASYIEAPDHVIEQNMAHLPEETQRKLLYENAARVYGLPELEPVAPR